MQVKLFTIPITLTEPYLAEMNSILRGKKVMEVEQNIVSNEKGSCWFVSCYTILYSFYKCNIYV
jgi:hypothetical protein